MKVGIVSSPVLTALLWNTSLELLNLEYLSYTQKEFFNLCDYYSTYQFCEFLHLPIFSQTKLFSKINLYL